MVIMFQTKGNFDIKRTQIKMVISSWLYDLC